MKKTMLLALTCAATITLTSCNQDRDESFAETKVNTASSTQMTARSNSFIPYDVQSFYNTVKSNQAFTWGYTADGCFARAHKMAQILQGQQNVQKIFIYGTLANKWRYHVAILINGEYVLDPALDPDGPLTKSEWISKCTNYHNYNSQRVDIQPVTSYSPQYYEKSNNLIEYYNYNTQKNEISYSTDPHYSQTNQLLNDIKTEFNKGQEIARSLFGTNSARR